MEYKLELLQKRVNHLEDLILAINDKIGSVLEEFFNHRAKRAADEESICLSLLTKFKSSFEIPERTGPASVPSGPGSVSGFGQAPASVASVSDRASSSESSFSCSESGPTAPAKQEPLSPPRPKRPSPPRENSSNRHIHNTRAATAAAKAAELTLTSLKKSATPCSSATVRLRTRAPPPAPEPYEEETVGTATTTNRAAQDQVNRKTIETQTDNENIVELITIDDEDNQNQNPAAYYNEDPEPEDTKPGVGVLQQVLKEQNNSVFGNYREPAFASNPAGAANGDGHFAGAGDGYEGGNENMDCDDYDPVDDSDAITIYSDDGESDEDQASTSAFGDRSQNGAISMLCEPELFIKTENAGVGTSFCRQSQRQGQVSNPHATATADVNRNLEQDQDQEDQYQMPNFAAEVEAESAAGTAEVEERDVPEPTEPETENTKTSKRSATNYKRIRSFNTLAEGRLFLKVNGMATRGGREAAEGTRYSYGCKDKRCKKLMYLLENRDTGRTALFEKMGTAHNHPAIRVILRPPRPKSRPGAEDGPPAPAFKLVQTFQSRADAGHKVQEQDPDAWILHQVVECPDDVKAYYTCGLTTGHSCPVSMVLRTFNENGKVDQYIWQGEHVHVPDAATAGAATVGCRTLADYFTPPVTVRSKRGRSYVCVRSYATEEEARTEVKADTDAVWEQRTHNYTLEGKKTYFFCKHRKCPMTMYLRGVVLAGKVFQYVSEGQHDHSHSLGATPTTRVHRNSKPGRPRAPGKRGKHVPRVWAQVAAFTSEDEARNHMRGEMAWTMRSWKVLKDCKVIYYCCKHDMKCPVRSYVRVENETGAVKVFVTTQDAHVHTPGAAKRSRRPALPTELKIMFDELYGQGLLSAEKILQELQRRGTQVPAYHVFEYVARMRRLKYGVGRGRRAKVKVGLRKKAVVGRVLSMNPKNEKKRKEKAEKAAAKKREREAKDESVISRPRFNTPPVPCASEGVTTAPKTETTAAANFLSPRFTSRATPKIISTQNPNPRTPRPAVAIPSTSSSSNGNGTPANSTVAAAAGAVHVKTEPLTFPIDPQLKMSPFRKMFGRQACIKLKRIELVDLSRE